MTSNNSGSSAASPVPAGTKSVSPATSPTARAGGGTPTAGPAVTPGGSQGQVKLEIVQNTYASSDNITVLITNASGSSIFVSPYQTECTMLLLERSANNGWISRKDCLTAPASGYGLTEIKAGQSIKQILKPISSGGMRPASAASVWAAGTYRVTLAYSPTPDSESATYTLIHSSNFVIN